MAVTGTDVRIDSAADVAESMRAVLRQLPTSVAVVAGVSEGRPYGLAVGTFTSVSLDPPLVGFLPIRQSRSWQGIKRAGSFAVSLLGEDQLDVCDHFASRIEDKFSGSKWGLSPSNAPVIENCLAWFDCTIHAILPAGDHDFVLGAVTATSVERHDVAPLIFFRRGYHRPTPVVVANDWLWG